jgi:hypothetical protein
MQLTHKAFPHVAPHLGGCFIGKKAKVNRQIQALIKLGKMKNNDYEYACKVNLLITRDGNKRFCGDYRPLNMQTRRDSFLMTLIDDVLFQMGFNQWFNALDLQYGFWQI